MDGVETHLLPTPTAPAMARTFVRSTLDAWGLARASAVAEMLATELVSNVVRHVRAPMTLRVLRAASSIRVEVDDASIDAPVARLAGPLDEHGRGLLLVAALAHRWGVVQRDGDGKTVWFEVDVMHAPSRG